MTPHISISALWRSLRRLLSVLILFALVGLGTAVAVVVQAGRTDSPPADAAIVMLTADRGAGARLDRARQLYLEGKISRILLAGNDLEANRTALQQRGVKDEAIMLLTEPDQIGQLGAAKLMLDQAGLSRALLIAEPVETLRLLKIARDTDVRLLTLPTGVDDDLSIDGVLRETGRYFSYVLLNR